MVPGQFTHGRRRCAVTGAEDHSLVVNQEKVWLLPRQHCRLTICNELVELTNSIQTVSDDKIQITILILRRGALSNRMTKPVEQFLPKYLNPKEVACFPATPMIYVGQCDGA